MSSWTKDLNGQWVYNENSSLPGSQYSGGLLPISGAISQVFAPQAAGSAPTSTQLTPSGSNASTNLPFQMQDGSRSVPSTQQTTASQNGQVNTSGYSDSTAVDAYKEAKGKADTSHADALAMLWQNYNAVDPSAQEQRTQATETNRLEQSRMNRLAASQAAAQGVSTGGGAAQAGAAQASLVGRQKLTENLTGINQWATQAKMNAANAVAQANIDWAKTQVSNAQQAFGTAANESEQRLQREAITVAQGIQQNHELWLTYIQTSENPDDAIQAYFDATNNGNWNAPPPSL